MTNYNKLWFNVFIIQDKSGIIYVGNCNFNMHKREGLHQFDGVAWRIINEPKTEIFSMALDDNNTIYTGGNNEIGFIYPDSIGVIKYMSLVNQLPEDKRDFEYVDFTHVTKAGIYFNSGNYLFRWNPISKKMKIWKSKETERFLSSFKCRDEFFLCQENVGVIQIENDELKSIPGSQILADKHISMMIPYNTHQILIGTKENGLYLFDGTSFIFFSCEMDEFFKKNRINHGIRLSSGDFALATAFGGLVIMNDQGKKLEIFDRRNGLLENDINYIFEDQEGNIWLALDSGISKIEYKSPITINNDLSLLFFSIIKHNGVLYAGTENGLFFLAADGKFHHIPGTLDYFFNLYSIDESLFATSSNTILEFEKNKMNVIIDGDWFYCLLRSSKDQNRIWVGGKKGLYSIYRKNNHWENEYHFKSISKRIESIVEDDNGNLWLGLNLGKSPAKEIVWKIDFSANIDLSSPRITQYRITQEKMNRNMCFIFKAADHIIFSIEKGLYRLNEGKNAIIPDFTYGNQFAGGRYTKGIFVIIKDRNKNIWLRTETKIYFAKSQKNGTFEIRSKPFQRIEPFYWFPIYPDPEEDITWIGGKGKLIRYDHTIKKNYHINFPTLIRKVVANGNLVYGGNKKDGSHNSQLRDVLPTIAYENRSLNFEFAAPFFEDETRTQYRYRLEGYDNQWSEWGRETKKEYNSLYPGLYRFRAQSKNIYQVRGREAVFKFRILPPWYKTWWAFLSYVIILSILSYLIFKWRRSSQLEKEKKRLEQTIVERTKEIKKKNALLEEQSEKLKEMDKLKSRFFANISHEFRTPLTIIMAIQEQISSHWHNKILKKKISIAQLNSHRLLSLINQLLDLSKLDSGKMKLKVCQQNIVPFIKGIISYFNPLIEKKKLDLTLNIKKEIMQLYFDTEKLELVILNLLANAVKFTPNGGKIMISISEKAGTGKVFPSGLLEITINDTGPGIPREELANIFDRFYQSDKTYNKHPMGTGIGLALAKELVEVHHGSLTVESIEGKGTEFTIQLPLGDLYLKEEEITDQSEKSFLHKSNNEFPIDIYVEREQDGNADLNNKFTKNHKTISRTMNKKNQSNNIKKNIILVVEDNADLRHYIKECLKPQYKVIETNNGYKGIEKAKEVIPDLIISDILMPEVDGYELCRQLKNHVNTCHIPIILLTAKATEENIIEGLEKGADDYITKPFNTKILCARIKNLIDLRHQLQLKRKDQLAIHPKEIAILSMDEEFYQEVQDIIEKNLSNFEFNVDQLAKKLYLSRSSLYRKISALTGETPQQLIRTYRLKRAAQLLKANFGNVTEVAQEVGFSSITYFTHCFKNQFQQLPSSYQNPPSEVKSNRNLSLNTFRSIDKREEKQK